MFCYPDYIIDIQGFQDKNKKFFAKEVAITTLAHSKQEILNHWIVRAPYVFTALPRQVQFSNNFCTNNIHGLEWFEGDCPLHKVEYNLRELTKNSYRIYTRGRVKAEYLESVIGRKIINFEDFEAPTFHELKLNFGSKSYVCATHGLKKKNLFKVEFCALRRALNLKYWLISLVKNKSYISSDICYEALKNYRKKCREEKNKNFFDIVDGVTALNQSNDSYDDILKNLFSTESEKCSNNKILETKNNNHEHTTIDECSDRFKKCEHCWCLRS